MDDRRFDALARFLVLSTTRRSLLKTAAGTALGSLLTTAGVERVAAALRQNGKPCRRGSQCASGLCKGPRGEKTCRQAPSQGICTIADNSGEPGATPIPCGAGSRCFCWVTTSGRSFCGQAAPETCGCGADNRCGTIPGAVCVQNFSCGPIGAPTACVLPCPSPA